MKKKYLFIIIVIALAVLAVFAARRYFGGKERKGPAYTTAVVTRRDIGSTVRATGIIKPMVGAEVRVGSRVSGVVKRLRSHIGDLVKEGQVIAELDDAELQAKLNQNIAALEKAKADLEYARLNLERQRSLLNKNFASKQQVDLAENANKVAQAQLEQAEANVEFARVQLGYAKIFAPISGVIASIATQEGETVAASFSAPTFVNIIDLNRLEVQTYVDETDIGKVHEGLEAGFTVDTYAETDFRGKVTAIYPKAVIQDNVVNYIVTFAISDFQGRTLRPEMTANVTIFLATRKNVLAVPTAAIVREQGERFVTVLDGDRTERREIKAGWKDNSYTEIIGGVSEGEKVIIYE
jgi:macrolide-specific efflux system membrane fusion protein